MKPAEEEFRMMIPRRESAKEEAVREMSKRFGGVTVFPVYGAWINKKGKTVYDKNFMLFSSRDLHGFKKSIIPKDKRFMEDLARKLGAETKQEAIWLEEDIIKDIELVKIPKLGQVL
jgi:hypothetical protein